MIQRDARSLDPSVQEELRKRAIHSLLSGLTQGATADLLGVARGTVNKWYTLYRSEGEQSLKKRKRGRRMGEKSKLDPWQCATLVNMIKDKCPDQLKLPFVLWTPDAVQHLIEHKFQIKLSIRTVGNYLKRWGFTPQKPIARAFERNDAKVKEWLTKEYPRIKERAQKEGGEIHWGDEAGFRSDHTVGKSYSPKGQSPIITKTGKRFRTNMISTVTNQGTLRFMLYDENFRAPLFIKFLKRLIKSSKRKIFLIVDNHKTHHAKVVTAWVEEHKAQIELCFLPPYTPELNPDELLNHDVKSNAVGRKRAYTLEAFKAYITSYLFGTQRTPQIVKNYFKKQEVAYAA